MVPVKDKSKLIIIILAVLLVIAVGYILFDFYQKINTNQQLLVYQQGIKAGYQQAVFQLIQQASTCQPVPITIDSNQVLNVIAVECLQAQQTAPTPTNVEPT